MDDNVKLLIMSNLCFRPIIVFDILNCYFIKRANITMH